MTDDYFSDRERGPRPRIEVDVRGPAWGGLVALINGAVANGGFGAAFPSECPDGRGITGTNSHAMGLAVRGEIPEIVWPLDACATPDTLAVLDLVEFSFAVSRNPSHTTSIASLAITTSTSTRMRAVRSSGSP